ncbi:hypothetical protein STEG23_007714 [Scotinomys teguina]
MHLRSGPRCAEARDTRQERPQAVERLHSELLPAEPRRSQAEPAPGLKGKVNLRSDDQRKQNGKTLNSSDRK